MSPFLPALLLAACGPSSDPPAGTIVGADIAAIEAAVAKALAATP